MLSTLIVWLWIGDASFPNHERWVSIGSVPGLGLPQYHVENLLLHSGIDAQIEGSVVYGISVDKKNKGRALAILKKDASIRPFMYCQLDTVIPRTGAKIQSNLIFLNADLGSLAKVEAISKDPLLEGLVRAAIVWESPRSDEIVSVYATNYKKFEYMNTTGGWEAAYFGRVIYVSRKTGDNIEKYAWSWDKGKRFSIANSNVFDRRH